MRLRERLGDPLRLEKNQSIGRLSSRKATAADGQHGAYAFSEVPLADRVPRRQRILR